MKKISTIILASSVAALSLCSMSVYAGTCSVTVTWSNGKPHKNVKVEGAVSGLTSGMTKSVLTDDDGKATLEWGSDNSLSKVFVDGKDRGPCSNNGSVHVTVD